MKKESKNQAENKNGSHSAKHSEGVKKSAPKQPAAKSKSNGAKKPVKNSAKPAAKPSQRRGKKSASKLKIIPLGGLEQIGMNITAFEYEESIVVVDCGLSFPEDDMLGIDLVIPDTTYLKENISKVKGFVITHGHEDHIGALPYVLKEINVPIYSTKLTLGLITNKLREHNLVKTTKLKEVRHGQVINLGHFSVEFVKTNHRTLLLWLSILRQALWFIQETLKWIIHRCLEMRLIFSVLQRLARRVCWL